jgi:hypothetical protein
MAGTAIQPRGEVRIDPWQPASEVSRALGWSLALFGYPGSGKTTFGATDKTLIVDLEGGTEVLADRPDVMVWPRKDKEGRIPKVTWDEVMALSDRLRKGDHPFEVIVFDTLSAAQRLTLQKVMKASPTPDMPSMPEWGKSNELLLQLVREWCALAKETGINVIFNCHAEEVKDESTGTVLIRMSLTPGVIKGVYQAVSSIGYLAEDPKSGKRKLLLRSTNKVLAKYRQPLTGPQLPLEIDDPSIEKILKHRKGALQHLDKEK